MNPRDTVEWKHAEADNPMKRLDNKLKTIVGIIITYKNWLTYMLNYFKLIDEQYIIIKLRNGFRYKIRTKTHDNITLNETWIKHVYDKHREFFISPCTIVVDIGAHIGSFTVYAAKLGGQVYSFEPEPQNRELLDWNIFSNSLINVTTYPYAVSGKEGKKTLWYNENNTGGHTLMQRSSNCDPLMVKTITLESLFKVCKIDYIDFLKMDCEGSEFDILYNTPKKILGRIRNISMEYHDQDSKDNGLMLCSYLRKKGYKIEMNKIDHMIYAWR